LKGIVYYLPSLLKNHHNAMLNKNAIALVLEAWIEQDGAYFRRGNAFVLLRGVCGKIL
jgi:hypothetical protein